MGLLCLALLRLTAALELPLTRLFTSHPIWVLDLDNEENAFSLTLDTVFPYLVVDDAQCRNCTTPVLFDRAASRTYTRVRTAVHGNAPAVLGQDNVVLGQELRVSNQTMISMLEPLDSGYDGSDGLLVVTTQGLGFERPHTGDLNLVENLKKQGVISSAVFAVYLDNRYTVDGQSRSVVSFGSWNLSAYSSASEFTFVPVNTSAGLWELELENAAIGEIELLRMPKRAFIDSAQNLLVLPEDAYRAVHAEICSHLPVKCKDQTTKWKCKDGVPPELPDLTMTIGGVLVRISPRNYIDVWNEQCHLRIAAQDNMDYWILGTGFMHEYYLLFDIENSRLGLAPVAEEEAGSSALMITAGGLLGALVVFGAAAFIIKIKLGNANLRDPFLSCG